jgi:hypothetical protein
LWWLVNLNFISLLFITHFHIQGFETMGDIQEDEDTPHPDHYDPYSPKNVERQRRIRELNDMIKVVEEKSAKGYWKLKDSLERESDKDPRYAKLLEATSDLISKALLVRPDTSKLTKSFNRAYFEIMRHILRILINPPERTACAGYQYDKYVLSNT